MEATKAISRLQRDIEREVSGFDEDAEFSDWARDSLLPLLEAVGGALGQLADETEAGFTETADVLAEVLDDEDDEEEYLIPAEITAGAAEMLNLASSIIGALIDQARGQPSEGADVNDQIVAFDVGAKALLEKMAELTEDEEDLDDDEDDEQTDGDDADEE